YFAADMVNLVVGSYLEASIAVPKGDDGLPGKGVTPIAIKKGGSDYHSIVEGNIFNSELRWKKPEPVQSLAAPPEIVPVPKAPLNLTLVGTIVGGGTAYAVIEDSKTKEQTLYRVGHLLAEGAKIAEVGRNRIVVLRGSEREVWEVSYAPKGNRGGRQLMLSATPPVPPAGLPPSGGGVRQVSRDRWILDRQEIDGAISNLPQLLTKARIIPNFSNGKPDGFRIFAISKESLYSKIGLQNGDILRRVNGIEVKDPKNFLKVFEQLKDESKINVDLVRKNQKETFSYEIR
ncbi:MAG: type II secretion system protein GspC, partial [Nitrospiria bacterium]